MTLGFLTEKRLITDRLSARTPVLYLFGLVFALLLAIACFAVADLGRFRGGDPIVTIAAITFTLIGGVGFAGPWFAAWLSVARRGRMPQPFEWLLVIVPLTIAFASIFLSGAMVRTYAAAHGYHWCAKSDDDGMTMYVFAGRGVACPRPAPGQ